MLEVIVVMAIFILVSSFSLIFSMGSFNHSTFRGDRDLFVSMLQRARAQSISNMCIAPGCADGTSHGVKIVGNTYVLFEGSSYATRISDADSVFEANAAVTRSGDSEVVFAQLTGTTIVQREFVHMGSGQISTTTVQTNGRIFWTD